MDRLPLSIFSRLSDAGLEKIRSIPGSKRDPYEDLIYGALLSTAEKCDDVLETKEVLFYSKLTDGEIRIGDKGALRQSLILPTAKGKCINNRYIGGDLTSGFSLYVPASAASIYQTDDVRVVVDSLDAAPSLVSLRRILLLLVLIPLDSANHRKFLIRKQDQNFVLEYIYSGEQPFEVVNYTGFRFESLVTAPATSETYHSYYTLLNQRIGDLLVHFTAEIDAGWDEQYIELKTHSAKAYVNTKQYTRKLLVSYCQTKLIDCQNLIIGFRTSTRSRKYKLDKVQRLNSNSIPKIINQTENSRIYVNYDTTKTLITCTKLMRWYILVMTWINLQLHRFSASSGPFSLEFHPLHNPSLAYLEFRETNVAPFKSG